jgi:hypothetical protein
MCADGFEHDGDVGCEPILPAQPCSLGLMALPGESLCRPVMDCGADKWGDIPVDVNSEHVDASYGGVGSDGSADRPWTSIGDAVAAAAPGALIAIAEGSYAEDVVISGKSVMLVGRCPDRVALVGTGVELAALFIREGADGTLARGLALTGQGNGVLVSGAEDVVLDKIWVHDSADRGIGIQSSLGPTSVSISESLVERSRGYGVFVTGSEVSLESVVVRATQPRASDQGSGTGVSIGFSPSTMDRSTATVSHSLIEQNHESGLLIDGSDATVSGIVVRTTQPRASDARFGLGIAIQKFPSTMERATAVLSGSLVEDNYTSGVTITGSDATIDALVVRGTRPSAFDQDFGRGVEILIDEDTSTRSSTTLSHSLVEQNHEIGVFVSGSDATIESVVARLTQPQAFDQAFGRGIEIQDNSVTMEPSTVSLVTSVVEQNHDIGVFSQGTDATMAGLVVRDTLPRAADQNSGRGIAIQADSTTPGVSATLSHSLIENNHDIGLAVVSTEIVVEATAIGPTLMRASDGLFGDGVAISSEPTPALADIAVCAISDSERAGLSLFGGSVTLSGTRLSCSAFDLNAATHNGVEPRFDDGGGNVCGCDAEVACRAQSATLQPPAPL